VVRRRGGRIALTFDAPPRGRAASGAERYPPTRGGCLKRSERRGLRPLRVHRRRVRVRRRLLLPLPPGAATCSPRPPGGGEGEGTVTNCNTAPLCAAFQRMRPHPNPLPKGEGVPARAGRRWRKARRDDPRRTSQADGTSGAAAAACSPLHRLQSRPPGTACRLRQPRWTDPPHWGHRLGRRVTIGSPQTAHAGEAAPGSGGPATVCRRRLAPADASPFRRAPDIVQHPTSAAVGLPEQVGVAIEPGDVDEGVHRPPESDGGGQPAHDQHQPARDGHKPSEPEAKERRDAVRDGVDEVEKEPGEQEQREQTPAHPGGRGAPARPPRPDERRHERPEKAPQHILPQRPPEQQDKQDEEEPDTPECDLLLGEHEGIGRLLVLIARETVLPLPLFLGAFDIETRPVADGAVAIYVNAFALRDERRAASPLRGERDAPAQQVNARPSAGARAGFFRAILPVMNRKMPLVREALSFPSWVKGS